MHKKPIFLFKILRPNNKIARWILYFFLLLAFAFLVKRSILYLAPAGYSRQQCMTPIAEIRKSEQLLAIFTHIAKLHNFTWWIDYGALLGIVRGQTLLPYDKDIDATCFEQDIYKLFDLERPLQKYGIRRHGLTYVWEEDIDKIESGDEEEIPSKLEFYPVVETAEGYIVRPELVPYLNAKTMSQRIWWFLLRWTGVAFLRRETVLPLTELPMKRFIIGVDHNKHKVELSPKKKNNNNIKKAKKSPRFLYEVDENDPNQFGNWTFSVPVPRDSKEVLRVVYGESWSREIRWKVTCYV